DGREDNGARDAVDGQIARDFILVAAELDDAGAVEAGLRVLLHVEKVGRAQVAVARRVSRVDAGRLDVDVDRRVRGVVRVELELSAPPGEAAARLRDEHVPDGEVDGGVGRVDIPSGCGHLV